MAENLLGQTLKLLETTQMGYSAFFAELRQSFSPLWRVDSGHILNDSALLAPHENNAHLTQWRSLYAQVLQQYSDAEDEAIAQRLQTYNPITVPLRPVIESVWEPITERNDWQPLYDLFSKIQTRQ